MAKMLGVALVFAMHVATYCQLVPGTHVYWYKALTNGYNLQDQGGPNLPEGIIVHEGKIASANYSPGLGYAGGGFSCGSNTNDDQGWCGVFFPGDLNNIANAGGHVDSAFIRGEYQDVWSSNGPLCHEGPIAVRCGVVDVSFGIMMWGSIEALPDDAKWADLDPMNNLSFDMGIAGAEETINFQALAGRPTGNSDTPLLDSQFVKFDVTDQVNYILDNVSATSAWAIVLLSSIGAGSTGKFSISAGENAGGTSQDSTILVKNSYWTQDGNTAHLLAYGSLAPISVEKTPDMKGGFSLDNSPNPFNPTTTITYNTLGRKGMLTIYGSTGKVVRQAAVSGSGSLVWDAHDMPSGIYFSRLTIGNTTLSKRMVMLK